MDAVGVTLQYDMDAPLNAPTWLDGYQQFKASWLCGSSKADLLLAPQRFSGSRL